jgi:hypothetical protein
MSDMFRLILNHRQGNKYRRNIYIYIYIYIYIDKCTNVNTYESVEITNKMHLVIEFIIIPKFI